MGRQHDHSIIKFGKLAGPGIIAHACQGCGSHGSSHQIRTADGTDKQCVAGQNHPGLDLVIPIKDQGAHAVGGMTRCGQKLKCRLAPGHRLAIGKRTDLVGCTGGLILIDGAAGGFGKLGVAGYEIGVRMRQKHPFDGPFFFFGRVKVNLDIAIGINHQRILAAYKYIGIVRQHRQVELNNLYPWIFIGLHYDLGSGRIGVRG